MSRDAPPVPQDDDPDLPFIPVPDKHQRALDAFQARLERLAPFLRPQWREIVRLAATGHANKDIAAEVGVAPGTVTSVLQREHCQQYLALLTARIDYLEGPTVAARRQMLWRIATDNEDSAPRVAIQAVDVLNKQDGIYSDHLKPNSGDLNIQIINNFSQEPVREREARPVIEGHAVSIEVEIDDDHDS